MFLFTKCSVRLLKLSCNKKVMVFYVSLFFCQLVFANDAFSPSLEIKKAIIEDLFDEGMISKKKYDVRSQTLPKENIGPTMLNVIQGVKGLTGSITGRIVDENGNPLNQHIVTLYSAVVLNNPIETLQTDSNGMYQFEGLEAGDYVVFTGTNGDGYLHYVWQNMASGGPRLCHQCNNNITVDSYINVGEDIDINDINVSTQLGGVIRGTLKDATTLDAIDTLSAHAVNIIDNSYNLKFQFSYVDPSTGEYQITGIPNGNYKLFLEGNFNVGNEYIPQLYGGSQCNACVDLAFENHGLDLVIDGLNTINDIDFELNKGASISGKIVDADTGNALAGPALFLIFDELNNLITNHFILGTDADGNATGDYFIGGLLPGSYYLQGGDLGFGFYQREVYNNKSCYWSGCDRSLGDPLVLSALQAQTGVDFLLEKGGKISGSIVNEMTGVPIIDVSVQVQFIDEANVVVGGAIARNDGSYVAARAIPPGDYAVRTGNMFVGALTGQYINEKYNDIACPGLACDLTTADVNVTTDGTTAGIDFALSSGFSFSGTITDVATLNPIPGVHVLVYKDMGDGSVKFADWATTSDGNDGPIGSFLVGDLPAGTYYAITNNGSNLPFAGLRSVNGMGWLDILYDGILCPAAGCDILSGTPIVLSAANGAEPLLNIAVSQGASISGKVTDQMLGSPISDVQINVYNQAGDYLGSFTTNESGQYHTSGLEVGTYYLTTSSFDVLIDTPYAGDPCYAGMCDPFDAQPIVLSGQQNRGDIDFTLLPLASDFIFINRFE